MVFSSTSEAIVSNKPEFVSSRKFVLFLQYLKWYYDLLRKTELVAESAKCFAHCTCMNDASI